MRLSDAQALGLALRQAKRGQGQTADNPSVGCLIISPQGQALALTHTAPGGRPHGEIAALARAGSAAKGATVFVTLEPCVHQGRSGPCVDALITAQVRRVVCGVRDRNPEVAGKGMAKLRAAGIEAVEANDPGCMHHHLGFNRRMAAKRPYVVMKIATSADGGMTKIGAVSPVAITGGESRRQVHIMRARSDVIVTGRGTWEFDKPGLNVRLPGYTGVHPEIRIWDRNAKLNDLKANQIMIEAGPTLSSALFSEVDELHWYRSPALFGDAAVRPDFLSSQPLDFATDWPKFTLSERRHYGGDIREIWKA